jgi:hypothetical protein
VLISRPFSGRVHFPPFFASVHFTLSSHFLISRVLISRHFSGVRTSRHFLGVRISRHFLGVRISRQFYFAFRAMSLHSKSTRPKSQRTECSLRLWRIQPRIWGRFHKSVIYQRTKLNRGQLRVYQCGFLQLFSLTKNWFLI